MAPKRKKKIAIISGLVLALAIVSTLVAMKANAKNKGEVKLPVKVGKAEIADVQVKVTDVSVMTNRMSVTVRLTGGPTAKSITVPAEVSDDGDSVLIEVFVLFRE